ncbi:adenylate and guanylate cyclase catalytic domain protein [mine drainage metagenome]|uniref:Adenylate and guanylate cyclase catalytic domain protein n=1 Tax=mine drainage metagenome TaxID=410659 RepID=A0A1J5TN28_9ZZZZ
MAYSEFHADWTWKLKSSPDALWPLVADTERFNRDCGFPSVEILTGDAVRGVQPSGTRRLRARHLGLVIEWDERPFDWVVPRSFGVIRRFTRGPFTVIRARCDLTPSGDGGTELRYQTWFIPAGPLGWLALRVGAHHLQFRLPFDRVFRRYDQLAGRAVRKSDIVGPVTLAGGARDRVQSIDTWLRRAGQPPELVGRLLSRVLEADDLALVRMRPYAVADEWGADRRRVLTLFLNATRAGLLDFSWDILCPMCRGAKSTNASLSSLPATVHCDACQIDYTSNFDQSVELTFSPNPAVRAVARQEYCIGGPRLTPHIVAQQALQPGELGRLAPALEPGRYRVRVLRTAGRQQTFRVEPAAKAGVLALDLDALATGEPAVAPGAGLEIANRGAEPRVAVVERLEGADQSTTAAEVTSLQLFRDLFTSEVLRPGEQISVGSVTIVFTDLKGSTQMYREIGDAPAFSRVLTHFDVLRTEVAAAGGAIVKTMGDAIMAVFTRPAPALRAILAAQRRLALAASAAPWEPPPGVAGLTEPLRLKAGVHHGPCIAINQNDRLDYFGTTANLAARLCELSTGADLVVSDSVRADPEVDALLADEESRVGCEIEDSTLKGFADQTFTVCRLRRT